MRTILNAKRYTTVRGDTRMEMTRRHADVTGRVWPAGTVYQPASSGYDNRTGRDEQAVTIAGERVVFAAPEGKIQHYWR